VTIKSRSETDRRRSSRFANDELRWAAVVGRAQEANASFCYGVRTTGVYCLPSCPSRAPRRENVRFFATSAAAEAAGFRPCKRCRPGQPALSALHAAAVSRACRALDAGDGLTSLAALAKSVGLGPSHFHRVFKRFTGLTPKGYAAAQRAKRVRDELGRAPSVTQAIYAAGFNSSAPFYAKAARWIGMSASDYRRGGNQTCIHFATTECSLGQLLVAATDRGVCAIAMGDDRAVLLSDLRARFPKAELVEGDLDFADVVAKVVALVEKPAQGMALPLDVRGTAFQHRVWRAISEIAAGETRTYAELAERIGSPRATRTVAGACAANPVAIVIPCHRVVRGDGNLSGYRWGVERKRTLLEREAASRATMTAGHHTRARSRVL
jgi:AraC family transcriptional regulator of adaptative response/methylated-DNA-[protein]-cysteine methyltransferase